MGKKIDKKGIRTLAPFRRSGPEPDVLDRSTILPFKKSQLQKVYNKYTNQAYLSHHITAY